MIVTSSAEMLPPQVRLLRVLCALCCLDWGSLLLRPEHPDETATLCFFALVECRNPREWCAEPSAEVGWKRDYHKEKSGGWEPGGGKLIFVT